MEPLQAAQRRQAVQKLQALDVSADSNSNAEGKTVKALATKEPSQVHNLSLHERESPLPPSGNAGH